MTRGHKRVTMGRTGNRYTHTGTGTKTGWIRDTGMTRRYKRVTLEGTGKKHTHKDMKWGKKDTQYSRYQKEKLMGEK